MSAGGVAAKHCSGCSAVTVHDDSYTLSAGGVTVKRCAGCSAVTVHDDSYSSLTALVWVKSRVRWAGVSVSAEDYRSAVAARTPGLILVLVGAGRRPLAAATAAQLVRL